MIRQRTDLDGEWEFFPDPRQDLTPTTLRENEGRKIRVPGPWQAQFDDLRDYSGVAWYRRHFDLTDGRSNGQPASFVLHFGAVDYFTTVWLNGQQVGEHEGGYLPFELDVTDSLRRDGANELVVRVIDPATMPTFFPSLLSPKYPTANRAGTALSAEFGRACIWSAGHGLT